MTKETLCGYCGVGCKIEYKNDKFVGVKNYPTNFGLICKKAALSHLANQNRLTTPLYREYKNTPFKEISWSEAIKIAANKIKMIQPQKIGFYLSGQLLNEDYYIANKLAKGFIKTNNVDTNSRLCMASAVVAHKMVLGSDYVPLSMNEALNSELLIAIGANMASSHVVFFNRIKKRLKKGLKLIVIDPLFTQTAKAADLYIPIKPSTDIYFLLASAKRFYQLGAIEDKIANIEGYEDFLEKLKRIDIERYLKICEVNKKDFEKFIDMFINSKSVVSLWTMGLNQSVNGTSSNIALMNLHILTGRYSKNSGFLSLTGQPNAMGGREVGGLATTLAAHMDYTEENIKKTEDFWKTKNIPNSPGYTAYEMITKANLNLLLVAHTDPLYSLPNKKLIQNSLEKIDFIIELNAYKNSQTSKYANLILPALPWGEKRGTQTNLDRHISLVEPIRKPLKEAKADWEIFKLIAKELNFKGFDYESEEEIFNEYKEMTRLSKDLDIYKTDYKKLKTYFRWGKNYNPKIKLIFPKIYPIKKETKDFPFKMVTIRLKNHWHSMSKTAQYINDRVDFVLLNEENAKNLNIFENEKVWVVSPLGKIKLRAKIAKIKKNVIAIPMHNKDINLLIDGNLDPLSKEPEYNNTSVRIEKC